MLATAIQAITSFSLTQLLSKAAQRLIADLRMQVQQHIGRLSVSFYDATRTGVRRTTPSATPNSLRGL